MNHKLNFLNPLPPVDPIKHMDMLIRARSSISELKGACYGLPNPQLLLSPTILREALESSEIENIVTTLADVLQAQLMPEAEQSPADKEVLRYNQALKAGYEAISRSYLGSNAIRAVHEILIPKEPDYRKTQNALRNVKTGDIVYMPVAANLIPEYLSDLERFLNTNNRLDPVLKTIIAHYQLEAIHPFGDGNGRTGRILIVLCMIYYKLIDLPVLFISEYINVNKARYYDAFKFIEHEQNWEPFVSFMLEAIAVQAEKSTKTLLDIKRLHEEAKRQIRAALPKLYSRDLVDTIFSQPLITPTHYAQELQCTYQTASSHLKILEQNGFMRSVKVGKYLIFANTKLMEFLNQPHQPHILNHSLYP